MERLDECIKSHADMLDAGNIGSIYDLQALSVLHYYLKAEHEFTPAEVEALLSFQDPLDVARWCWEENTHEHSFPICDLLYVSAPVRFCHFSPNTECKKMASKGVQPLNNYTCRFRPSSLKCTDKSGLDGLQADK